MTAKEMFKKLGYEANLIQTRYYDTPITDIIYEFSKDKDRIAFDLKTKEILIDINRLSIEELKAINQQCKELDWLKED